MAVPRIQYGSKEFIAHNVQLNGVAVTTGYEYADVALGQAVTDWLTNPIVVGGAAGHLIGPGTVHAANPPGMRKVMARVTDSPEVPVIRVGEYRLEGPGGTGPTPALTGGLNGGTA